LERGDSVKAQDILEKYINSARGVEIQGEARTLLGFILRKSKNAEIKLQAQNHFTLAIAYFNQQIEQNPAVPSPYMWTGIALLGMNDAENAYEQLNQALFLESRPFYIGMINLWLGKASDARNKRDLAVEFYSEVMAIESASYHQKEARQYLETPYHQ
jgi:tetratricopeptide (TPR) repeat protein